MFVDRRVFRVRPGLAAEAAQAMREENNAAATQPPLRPTRIYTPIYGPSLLMAVEWTADTLEKGRHGWELYNAMDRAMAFYEKWATYVDEFVSCEIWNVQAEHIGEATEDKIAVRWTRKARHGRADDLAQLWEDWVVSDANLTVRLMRPEYGVMQTVVLELEAPSLLVYEQAFDKWLSQPDIETFGQQWNSMLAPGGSTEVWRLHL